MSTSTPIQTPAAEPVSGLQRCSLRIAADHPALPGHFPGQPIVPGVLLLDCVVNAAERWLGRELAVGALRQAKFTSMLLPEELAELELQASGQELRFIIRRAGRPIDSAIDPIIDSAIAPIIAPVIAPIIAQGAFVLEVIRDVMHDGKPE